MSDNGRTWDVSLTPSGNKGAEFVRVAIPTAISRPLTAAGMNRARISITADGILIKPYKGESGKGDKDVIAIPASWSTA